MNGGRDRGHRLRRCDFFVAIAFAIDAYLGFPFVHKLTHDSHGSGRLALWSAALAMLRDAPVLGHGPGSFVLEFRTYLDALQAPTATGSDSRVTPWAHNLYLELLAEQGAVGFVWFLALSAMGVTMLIQTLRGRDSDIRFLGAGAGAAFIAFLVAAFFELSFIRVWVPIALLTLFGLLSMLSRIKNRGVSAPAK
jgi:O-antigen ligase